VCVCVCVHRRYISDNIEQNSFLSSNLRRRFDRTKNQHQISCETREEWGQKQKDKVDHLVYSPDLASPSSPTFLYSLLYSLMQSEYFEGGCGKDKTWNDEILEGLEAPKGS